MHFCFLMEKSCMQGKGLAPCGHLAPFSGVPISGQLSHQASPLSLPPGHSSALPLVLHHKDAAVRPPLAHSVPFCPQLLASLPAMSLGSINNFTGSPLVLARNVCLIPDCPPPTLRRSGSFPLQPAQSLHG